MLVVDNACGEFLKINVGIQCSPPFRMALMLSPVMFLNVLYSVMPGDLVFDLRLLNAYQGGNGQRCTPINRFPS